MNKRFLFLFLLPVWGVAAITAQNNRIIEGGNGQPEEVKLQPLYYSYIDSLTTLKQKFENWHYTGKDTLQNPYYFRLFTVPTFYKSPIRKVMSIEYAREKALGKTPRQYSDAKIDLQDYIDRSFADLYTSAPMLVSETENDVNNTEGLRREVYDVKQNIKLMTKESPKVDIGIEDKDLDIHVYKPNFWKISGNYSLQFMQSYVSDNWYKGGESNNSLMANVTIRANYDNKQKVLFENTLEMKLGFQSSKSDKLHKYKTNSDLLRLTNKLGLQAIKSWYYTISLQSWTQFHPSYRSNDEKVYSDFMSPFESTVSVGMDYKKNLNRFNISANISPFACRLKYVDREALVTSYGIKAGDHSVYTYGSNITINYTWKIVDAVSWSGRIYYFTDYDLSQIEWENTFNLTINKYLSTKLFLYPRFDDSVNRKEGDSYFQFNEYLSLGLNMSF